MVYLLLRGYLHVNYAFGAPSGPFTERPILCRPLDACKAPEKRIPGGFDKACYEGLTFLPRGGPASLDAALEAPAEDQANAAGITETPATAASKATAP
ncbi:hypothetical protein cyc_03153 [Cyclospora cayetanensis]|uniref:Uncharacterized protein n=1 Tax=Cyclospora cayetanensis TaxID=88456 RepID=A0A1D3DAF6_9EIME|nr:hypothetical protein cyc_03153 [Cyclospora cayetanensis]